MAQVFAVFPVLSLEKANGVTQGYITHLFCDRARFLLLPCS